MRHLRAFGAASLLIGAAMRPLALIALFLLPWQVPAQAQIQGGAGGNLFIGEPITGSCTNNYNLFNNGGVLGCQANGGGGGLTVATTTITSGTNGRVLYDNSGVLGELAVTGSGSAVLATSPTMSGVTVTGSFTATGLVTNADLANAATTVNGQTCTLGSTCTAAAAAGTLTGTTLASNVVTSSLTSLAAYAAPSAAIAGCTIGSNVFCAGGATNWVAFDAASSFSTMTFKGSGGIAGLIQRGSDTSDDFYFFEHTDAGITHMRGAGGYAFEGSVSAGVSQTLFLNSGAANAGNKVRINLAPSQNFSSAASPYMEVYSIGGANDTGFRFAPWNNGANANITAMEIDQNGTQTNYFGLISAGTKPTLTGSCAVVAGTRVGGAIAGSFAIPAGNCIATTTVIASMPTAANGWTCDAHNLNTPLSLMNQTASSVSSTTFTITTVTAVAADVVTWKCIGY